MLKFLLGWWKRFTLRREDLALLQLEQVVGDYNLLKAELAGSRMKFLHVMHDAFGGGRDHPPGG